MQHLANETHKQPNTVSCFCTFTYLYFTDNTAIKFVKREKTIIITNQWSATPGNADARYMRIA